ncbi:MAG: hypothetical protein HY858_04700 [Candidatus Solibacter usitatus]|nr:hypothetical protein [Candidatus Solibacter usitatus]
MSAWAGGHRMFVTAVGSKYWIAGVPVKNSGIHVRDAFLAWSQPGFQHPDVQAVAVDPANPKTIFLAAGNGCIRSDDAGKTWRITTSWDMTELRDVAVDAGRPGHVYVALPDGLGVSRDGGKSWAKKDAGLTRRYTHTVAAHGGRVLRGGESGIWLSEDEGETWRHVSAGAAETTDIVRSPHDPSQWLAATQKAGLWRSSDGGRTWSRFEGVDGSRTIYNAAYDPTTPGRLAASGWGIGALVSEDGGKSWSCWRAGEIWRVAWDPDDPGRLYAGAHEDALYETGNRGKTWKKTGLDGTIIYDIEFGPEPAPKSFAERRQRIIEAHAAPGVRGSYGTIAAALWLKQDCSWCSAKLVDLLKEPQGDMFWMFPATAVAYLDRGQLSAGARAALRKSWQTYMPYRGDTENHWLLYYSTLYLMAQKYKGEPGSAWYTGKSSEENMKEAAGWIDHWMNLTIERGQGEYDCTHYIGVYFLPMSYLAAWAEDPRMRQRARMMLELLMADFAPETLNGLFAGAHARTDDRQVREKWAGVSSDFAWLLFGTGYPYTGFFSYTSLAAMSGLFEPPPVIQAMATGRDSCYTHRETKRTRNRWRFYDEKNGDVYKTTYMCPDYAVSSDQGGLLQPVQQHSWDVTWALPDPRGRENTLFALHPFSGIRELQTYFTFMPDFGTDMVVRSKRTYDSPDKFLGGSFHEQIAQDRDTLIALYDIPKGTRFEHINGFFSKDLDRLEEDPSGWIFASGGGAWIAFRPLQPYTWKPIEEGGKRLESAFLQNGVIMQAASAREFASWEEFKTKVRGLELSFGMAPHAKVRFRTLRGALLECEWGRAARVDGAPLDHARWKMYEGPWVNQERGSRAVTLRGGGRERLLDFSQWEARDVK